MRAAVQEIPSKYVGLSSSRVKLSTKNAWAKWARNRYPNNGVKGLMIEFGLTEGESKGVVYAQASQPTIDKLLDHARGGFALGLEILCLRLNTRLEDHIQHQAEEARRERNTWEARERHLERLEASLRTGGPSDAGLDR